MQQAFCVIQEMRKRRIKKTHFEKETFYGIVTFISNFAHVDLQSVLQYVIVCLNLHMIDQNQHEIGNRIAVNEIDTLFIPSVYGFVSLSI